MHVSIQNSKDLLETERKYLDKQACPQLILAVRQKNYEEVIKLLESDEINVDAIDRDDKNKTSLHIACEAGDLKMIKILESYNCNL